MYQKQFDIPKGLPKDEANWGIYEYLLNELNFHFLDTEGKLNVVIPYCEEHKHNLEIAIPMVSALGAVRGFDPVVEVTHWFALTHKKLLRGVKVIKVSKNQRLITKESDIVLSLKSGEDITPREYDAIKNKTANKFYLFEGVFSKTLNDIRQTMKNDGKRKK